MRSPDGIDVRAVLVGLSRSWPELDGCAVADLEAICRKLGVAATLHERYGPGWQRLRENTPLSKCWWPIVASCLLAYASNPNTTDQVKLGLSAKCLNAALQAIDIITAMDGGPDASEWAHHADVLCERIGREMSA